MLRTSKLGQRIREQKKYVHRELAFTARFTPAELAEMPGLVPDAGMEREAVLVQGVADLAMVAPKEIWLLDFKTDQLKPEELNSRAKMYERQVRLYAAALLRIYQRPVTESWLYFFELNRAVAVS
jgi:ATP-dependent helicase/nuclease subunit A